jgi:hypothetical protein
MNARTDPISVYVCVCVGGGVGGLEGFPAIRYPETLSLHSKPHITASSFT